MDRQKETKQQADGQGFACFGTGKQGERIAAMAREFGTEPVFFVDNNPQKSGMLCAGIPVFSPEVLQETSVAHILITSSQEGEIRSQLLARGIPGRKIITGCHNILNHLLYHAVSALTRDMQTVVIPVEPPDEMSPVPYGADVWKRRPVLYDLQNGLVLGGVETWTYGLARQLKDVGIAGLYLTTDTPGPAMSDHTYPACILPYQSHSKDKERIRLCMQEIESCLPCTVLCSFPQYTFWSACLVRKKYPGQIRILAVQHSDDPLYYEAYSLWRDSVDCFITLSSRMEQCLGETGVKQEQMVRMDWQVPCPAQLKRTWTGKTAPLRIGYAGRVTTISKRADLLTDLALMLREKAVSFILSIVGEGDYSRELVQKIRCERLEMCVKPIGYIDRKALSAFWNSQDVMISCSEREGHSLSQREAMAQGAVPVITDVSGARDDIKDGENGFIVDVGDLAAAAERIAYLHENRDTLEKMGKAAHQSVLVKQKDTDQKAFWLNLLKEVWEPCK